MSSAHFEVSLHTPEAWFVHMPSAAPAGNTPPAAQTSATPSFASFAFICPAPPFLFDRRAPGTEPGRFTLFPSLVRFITHLVGPVVTPLSRTGGSRFSGPQEKGADSSPCFIQGTSKHPQ
jgi:hypothetical protein